MPEPITYKTLLNFLGILIPEQLEMIVACYSEREDDGFNIKNLTFADNSDMFDTGHPLLIIGD